jgi:hypothetical protein
MLEFYRQYLQAAGGYVSLRPPYLIFSTLLGGTNTPPLPLHKVVPHRPMRVLPRVGQVRTFGLEQFDHISLFDFAHRDRKRQTDTIE